MGDDRRLASRRRMIRFLLLATVGWLPTACSHPSLPSSAAVSRDESNRPGEAPRLLPAPEKAIANLTGAAASVAPELVTDPPFAPSRDPAVERLLLLLPAAPLLVELRITIDGHPFRNLTDELVNKMIESADRDHDGRPTWGEVFADPKRLFGQSLTRPLNMSNRKEFMKANDSNRNGLVDRDEARRFLEELNCSSAAFSLASNSEYRLSGRSIVWKLLDANGDDGLDQTELAALESRLLSRDANDDQTVTWAELDDSLAGDEAATARRNSVHREDPAALLVGANADPQLVSDVLAREYPRGQSTSGPPLLGDLDADRDGQLSPQEIARLETLEPQVVLAASFGKKEQGAGLSLVRFSADSGCPVSQTGDAVLFATRGCRLRFAIDPQPAANDPWPSAEAQLAELDADKNGYLEKRELDGRVADARMFEEADANSDGKIDLGELKTYRQRQAPQLGSVYASVRYEQDFVFSMLDSDQDARLTTRELRAASLALRDLDASADGRITLEEISSTMVVVLGRGHPPQRSRQTAQAPSLATGERQADLPKWFLSMDANSDREISREEFPGSNAKFRSLDLDDDGFIIAGEARQAGE